MKKFLQTLSNTGVLDTYPDYLQAKIRLANKIASILLASSLVVGVGAMHNLGVLYLVVASVFAYLLVLLFNKAGFIHLSRVWLAFAPTLTISAMYIIFLGKDDSVPTGTWAFLMAMCLLPWLLFDIRESQQMAIVAIFPVLVGAILPYALVWVEIALPAQANFIKGIWFVPSLIVLSFLLLITQLIFLQHSQYLVFNKQQKLLQQVQELNETLDEKIQARTKELEETNQGTQATNEELQASEEELKQNLEQLQTTQEKLEKKKQKLIVQNEALSENERKTRQILEGTNVGTWEWNVQTGETIFNERWAEIAGYTLAELAPIDIQTWLNLAHPDDLEESGRKLQACFDKTADYYNCEARMRHKDGHWVWVLDRGRVFEWTEDGKPLKMFGTHQDINNHKKIEQHLVENETKLRNILDSMRESNILIDTDFRILSFNKVVQQTIKAIHNKDIQLFEDFRQYIVQGTEEDFYSDFQKALSGEHITLEKRFVFGDAEQWYEVNYYPVFDQNNHIIGVSFNTHDITQRKQAEEKIQTTQQELQNQNEKLFASEEELKQNLEELHTVQDTLEQSLSRIQAISEALDNSAIVSIGDLRGNILKVNRIFCEISGYSEIELLGKNHNIVNSGHHSKEFWIDMWKTISSGKTWRAEVCNQAKDGTLYWVDTVINPIFDQDNEIAQYLSIRSLITKRKEVEDSLKKRNELLITNQHQLEQTLMELYNAQNALTLQKKDLENTLKELRETQNQLIHSEKMASLGQLVASVAHEINTPLGAIQSSANNVLLSLPKVLLHFPVFMMSLPDEESQQFLVLLERILNQKNAPLASKEARRIRSELASHLENLQVQKSSEIAEFLVDMGVRDMEILGDIWANKGIYDYIKKMYEVVSIFKSTENILVAIERASKIIFALKNFSRQDQLGEKSPTNLNESIETVLTLYHNQIKQGIEIVRNFEALPKVPCYQDEIVQVWTNLVHNAMHAMAGKGTLTITTKQEDNSVIVEVQDTGLGIAPEIQDKIFNAFFTTKPQGEGSGLGLDIVKKIINKHAGKIWFETEAGKGSTFFVEIPV